MSDRLENPPLINDPAREATASMYGYASQIWRSVLIWLDLQDTERMYLEGAEDIDLIHGAAAETTQVKYTAGNITLRSPDVVEAINNAWLNQERNRDRPDCIGFASRIGRRHGGRFVVFLQDEARSRRLLCGGDHPPQLGEGAVRRHEARQHRPDQLCGLDDALAGLARERVAIGDQIAMEGCRQLDGQLDRLIVRDRSELQLRHGSLLTWDRVQEPDRG
jgi:hypothetical protein